jgi:hypothetical protein
VVQKQNNMNWVTFTTGTGLKAKYQIAGEDLRTDVKIKIISPTPKSYYYSALNEAGAYYEKFILPKIETK